ncbi:MAG TPA: hypothetical protein VFR22_00910 [Nocardioidaceae bacterium]|nr:hypothetical protein [Nocardioidaceae bacterium]
MLSWTVWAAFAVDFLIRIVLANQRWRYAWRCWYDVALIALLLLRPLRLLQLLALARILNRSVTTSLSLLGAITASVAAWMVAQVQQDHSPESDEARQPQ